MSCPEVALCVSRRIIGLVAVEKTICPTFRAAVSGGIFTLATAALHISACCGSVLRFHRTVPVGPIGVLRSFVAILLRHEQDRCLDHTPLKEQGLLQILRRSMLTDGTKDRLERLRGADNS